MAWETGWSSVFKIVNMGFTFLASVLLTRLLGAEGFGVYSFALALATVLSVPAQLGLPSLVMRETAGNMARGHPDRVKGVWHWSGWIVGAVSLMLAVIVGISIRFLGEIEGSIYARALIWALALIPLLALGNIRGAALRGLQHILTGQLPEHVIRPTLFLIFLIAAGVLKAPGSSAQLAMALHAFAALVTFIAGAWLLWQKTPPVVRSARPSFEGRTWLFSSLTFALIAGFSVINNQASVVILGIFTSPEQVGIYRVALQMAGLASFGLQVVNMVLAPRFADLHAQERIWELERLVQAGARAAFAFGLVLAAFLVLTGRPVISMLFGPDFTTSYGPLVILLVGQLVNSAVGSVGYVLNMSGHERKTANGMAVASVINLILNLLLIPLWGIFGAAAAAAISMAVWNIILWRAVKLHLGFHSLAFKNPRGR
jgi:O-antigen/teichoic acid export membrane protein